MTQKIVGELTVKKERFALVVSRTNEFITSKLLSGAVDELTRHGCAASQIVEVWAPGSFELPSVARALAKSGQYDAVICLGCVIRGHTPHFEYIASEVAKGVAQVGLETGMPILFGVITADTIEQAVERAGTKAGNRGADAARSAIEMVNLFSQIKAAKKKRS